ncbi:MAG TPA: protein phosphatase CheZ [Gallionellaceae bacterium]|nr:protein phosphatase CheZ [Gallionellaceae bacterium]
MSKKAAVNNDSDDLESLFDSIVSANKNGNEEKSTAKVNGDVEGGVFNEIGHLTRALHDSLRELGYDKNLQKVASAIPDSRDRLNYIATMTQAAAERVLTATEAAQPTIDKIESGAKILAGEWQKLFDNKLDVEQFKQLAMQTHAYLVELPKQTRQTSANLTEIMMAQDFQDLTGQVIKKVMEVTQNLEQQLLALLVHNAPASVHLDPNLLNGPVVNPAGRTDVVTSQAQVDDLLESLGF